LKSDLEQKAKTGCQISHNQDLWVRLEDAEAEREAQKQRLRGLRKLLKDVYGIEMTEQNNEEIVNEVFGDSDKEEKKEMIKN
jgi:hypothetical protein